MITTKTATRTSTLLLLALLVSGCAATAKVNDKGNYEEPIGRSLVTDNDTQYDPALKRIQESAEGQDIRICTGEVEDLTGTYNVRDGHRVSQGGNHMVTSALLKAGFRVSERTDMSVPNTELNLVQLRGNIAKQQGTPPEPLSGFADSVMGKKIVPCHYYVTGAVTELNFNIGTKSAEVKIPEVGIGGRYAVMNVGMDLRLVDASTTEVVSFASKQKQILGREFKAGFFDFIGDEFTVANLQSKDAEPVHFAMRTVIEWSIVEMTAGLVGLSPSRVLEEVDAKHLVSKKEREWRYDEEQESAPNVVMTGSR